VKNPCVCGHPASEHEDGQECYATVPVRLNDGSLGRGPCDCKQWRLAAQQMALEEAGL